MSTIDWSDPEGLFDMLVEYVADAKTEAHADARREPFLTHLLSELMNLQSQLSPDDLPEAITQLRRIHDAIDEDFVDDPVVEHVAACLEDLGRIGPTASDA